MSNVFIRARRKKKKKDGGKAEKGKCKPLLSFLNLVLDCQLNGFDGGVGRDTPWQRDGSAKPISMVESYM